MKKKQQKQQKNNYFKKIIAIIIFISVTVQINIFIADSIKDYQHQQKIKKEAALCPPDICTYTDDEYSVSELPDIEILDIDVKPIK